MAAGKQLNSCHRSAACAIHLHTNSTNRIALAQVKNPWPNVDAHSGVILQYYGITEEGARGASRGRGLLTAGHALMRINELEAGNPCSKLGFK